MWEQPNYEHHWKIIGKKNSKNSLSNVYIGCHVKNMKLFK